LKTRWCPLAKEFCREDCIFFYTSKTKLSNTQTTETKTTTYIYGHCGYFDISWLLEVLES